MFGQPNDAEQLAVKDWLVEKADIPDMPSDPTGAAG
mgnify:CR=1 FL=1|jgi:hypothetical protein